MSLYEKDQSRGIRIDSSDILYSRDHGPWQLLPHASAIAEQKGIPLNPEMMNCQLFLHYIYGKYFNRLPQMWSREIFEDNGQILFMTVASTPKQSRDVQQFIGDIYMFEPMPREKDSEFDSVDPRNLHLAIGTGQFADHKPLLMHVNTWDGTVGIWPFDKFFKPVPKHDSNAVPHKRYKKLVAIKRLKPDFWQTGVKPYVLDGQYFYIPPER